MTLEAQIGDVVPLHLGMTSWVIALSGRVPNDSVAGVAGYIDATHTLRFTLDPVGTGYYYTTLSGNSFSSAEPPPPIATPEPASLMLLASGLVAAGWKRRGRWVYFPRMPGDITRLLHEWQSGNTAAGDEVVTRTYGELRRVAHGYLRRERVDHSLQTTALLHEAYLRLLRKGPGNVEDRAAFFRLMAAEMRRRLVDHARRRLALKRGGGIIHDPLHDSGVAVPVAEADGGKAMLSRLDGATEDLGRSFPRAARVVQLRFLAGLTTDEAAAALGLSAGTVKRDWTFARAWLAAAIQDGQSG